MNPTVMLFTDGACRGNPGPGGWGVLIRRDGQEAHLSGHEDNTTNNRMELTAVIEGLKSIEALCKRYHVDNTNRELHGALLDSELLAQVYLYMTGGQSQLFDTTDVSDSPDSTADKTTEKPTNREALPIIQPNEEELAAHQQYLTSMQEKGACDWLESDQ